MPKFQRRPDARPAEILDAALKLFAEKGFAATTMAELAAMAGVTAGTIYRYFPSKDALIDAVVDRHLDFTWARGREIAEAYGTRTAREIVELLMRRWAAALTQPEAAALLLVMVREAGQFPPSAKKYVEQLQTGCLAIERALRHGIVRGEFPLLDVTVTARALAAIVIEGTLLRSAFGEHLPSVGLPNRPHDVAIEMSVRGLPRVDGTVATSDPRPADLHPDPVDHHAASSTTAGGLRIVTLRPPPRPS